ncbi:hypothetical protein ACC712_38395, partial [Rhizobium ruizarguesonis]
VTDNAEGISYLNRLPRRIVMLYLPMAVFDIITLPNPNLALTLALILAALLQFAPLQAEEAEHDRAEQEGHHGDRDGRPLA